MTFGYAAAAFRQSTAEVIDYVKSLLSSLVDKRREPEVQKFFLEATRRASGSPLMLVRKHANVKYKNAVRFLPIYSCP